MKRIAGANQRIMTGNDVRGRCSRRAQGRIPLHHIADMKHDRKRRGSFHVFIKMAGIRGQHDPAARRMHTQRLKTLGVAADLDELHARRQLYPTLMKLHTLCIQAAHKTHHVFDIVGVTKQAMAHVLATGIVHFVFLNVKTSIREQVDIAGMVIMQVCQHYILDVL